MIRRHEALQAREGDSHDSRYHNTGIADYLLVSALVLCGEKVPSGRAMWARLASPAFLLQLGPFPIRARFIEGRPGPPTELLKTPDGRPSAIVAAANRF